MRVGLVVRGTVQGVGFRPFVRRAALRHGLTGFVRNAPNAVRIEVQGDDASISSFAAALQKDLPPAAVIHAIEGEVLDERDETTFLIAKSDLAAAAAPVLPPDLATCPACWADVGNASDRRFRYPFTNCTQCGPRYSIVTALPYDRPNTSMRAFDMCPDCAREYEDVDDRRHHAQPIACPRCGPTLTWCGEKEHAIEHAARALRSGAIVALRGLGGFQLLCDATDEAAVARLRERKRRPHKPFAVMTRDVDALAWVRDEERALLASPEAPIVLLPRREPSILARNVAPGSPWVGALLPYTPLHGLLLDAVDVPVVCTSGNLSEEPICIDVAEAEERLGSIADGFLVHDRPIVRPLDDSVVRSTARGPHVLRRARGYAPRAVGRIDERASVLALGAHAKSTVTLGHGGALVPSQHLGDLDSPAARSLLLSTVDDLCRFFGARPRLLACDLHPDYASTLLAEELGRRLEAPVLRVQHHHAHVAACAAEHGIEGPVLGLAWDGSGLGTDGTIWGGEALACDGATFERVAHLRPFPLPGGEAAARDPRRAAIGLLYVTMPDEIDRVFGAEAAVHVHAIRCGLNAPLSSSVGRLFDAVAALLGFGRVTFEGQAAMFVEALAAEVDPDFAYPLPVVRDGEVFVAETSSLVAAILEDVRANVDRARIARRFHEALVEMGVAMASCVARGTVVLGGGCFQNRLLLDTMAARLEHEGFTALTPRDVPANDGGISVGQAAIAARVNVASL